MVIKIIPRIFGGLGNQLFAYAAARRLALVNNAELVLDHISGFRFDKEYQQIYQLDNFNIPVRKANRMELLEPFSRVKRYLLRRVNLYRPFGKRCYLSQEGIDFDSRVLDLRPSCRRLYLEGYWQSERYFKDIDDVIRKDLKMTPPVDEINQTMVEKIKKHNAVAVHVRFFDNPEKPLGHNASIDYYQRAIEEMQIRVSGAHYYIFSDRPDAAMNLIKLPVTRVTLVDHNTSFQNAYADLWLMTHCKHFIIANSTFSWWGAWLSESQNKIIIAPGFKIREGKTAWGFDGLLPDNWIKM